MERYAPTAKDLASARRGVALDDDRDQRRARLRAEQGPHPAASRASRRRPAARAAAGHFRDRAGLRRRRCDQGADPGAADGALQHGRRPDEPSRRGAAADARRSGRGGARADGGRRGGVRVGARRQPAGHQLAARSSWCSAAPRRMRAAEIDQARREPAAAAAEGRRAVAGPLRPRAARQGRHARRRPAARDAAHDADATPRCSATAGRWPRACRRCSACGAGWRTCRCPTAA